MTKYRAKYRKPPAARQGQARQRRCLDCRESFASSWPGNRICPKCTNLHRKRTGIGTPASCGRAVPRRGGA